MIQIATILPTVATVPAPSALRAAESGASSFALVMSLMLAPGIKAVAGEGEGAAPETAVPALQVAAEPGKDLPEAGLELPTEETEAEPEADVKEEEPAARDPAFAWFALLAPPLSEPLPAAIAATVARPTRGETPDVPAVVPEIPKAAAPDAPSASAPAIDAESVAEAQPPQTEAAARAAVPATRAERGSVAIPRAAPVASGDATPAPVRPMSALAVPSLTPAAVPATPATPSIPATPATSAPAAPGAGRNPAAPAPAPEIASAPALAAAAPAAVQPTGVAPLRRAVPREPDQPAVTSFAAPSAAALQQVAATADVQQGALDLRRQEWMGQMVERIEALRDAAPIRETRIALLPDALGKVDVSVRHDGERVHVHFTAETQAARQILTDAQPRLTELAESRGVRLGQTSVDSGQAGANAQSGQRHEGQRPHTPAAPPRARAETDFTATEDRVA